MFQRNTPDTDQETIKLRVIRASDRDAEMLLEPEHDEIRAEIVRLFYEGKRSMDIAEELEFKLPLPPAISIKTKSSVIRRLIQRVVSEEDRTKMTKKKCAIRREQNVEAMDEGRDRWMEEAGMFRWEPAWVEYLLQLSENPDYQRSSTRLHHPKIVAKMNEHFGTDIFTPEITRREIEYLRKVEAAQNGSVNGNGNGKH